MKSNLITRGGHDKLVAELKNLWHEERPEITKSELGSQSRRPFENADYQYNKQLLRKIDRRVRYLGKRLEELRIVDFSLNRKVKFILVPGLKLKMNRVSRRTFGS